jgi:hypothetical protein
MASNAYADFTGRYMSKAARDAVSKDSINTHFKLAGESRTDFSTAYGNHYANFDPA